MGPTGKEIRRRSFGEDSDGTIVDRFGVWLSSRQIRQCVPSFSGKRVADVGCGYRARFATSLLDQVAHLTLLDVSLDPSLRKSPKVTAIEGAMPGALQTIASGSTDVLICNSVLEHLWEPLEALTEFHRILAPGAIGLVNVPSWRGKRFLELAAFRLGVSPTQEMDDHKAYYDPKDLWPILVRAGFRPRHIRCFTHKFGLNTFAACVR
jgi:2-polyprenyl-3-methyl-5-hydroxy-6-metoxy-1,4-benzoquinol methylase